MKRLTFFLVLLMAIATGAPAHAGSAAVPTWTGFYIGGNVGYGWSDASSSLTVMDGAGGACHFCGNDIGAVQAAGSPNFHPNGFIGGGQIGANYQMANWVYGAEIDFDSFSQKQTVNTTTGLPGNFGNCFSSLGGAVPCVANFSTTVKTDWLLTVRPRIGYAWGPALLYGTGGLAVSRLRFSQTYSDNIFFGPPTLINGQESASGAETKVGWALGGGFEYALLQNWSLKAEYLYVRFDGLNTAGKLSDSIAGDFANFSNNVDHFASNIVRVGFNYRFYGQ